MKKLESRNLDEKKNDDQDVFIEKLKEAQNSIISQQKKKKYKQNGDDFDINDALDGIGTKKILKKENQPVTLSSVISHKPNKQPNEKSGFDDIFLETKKVQTKK